MKPRRRAKPRATSSMPIVVTKKPGFALTVWLQKPNHGCSQLGWPRPASAIIWAKESAKPGWNLNAPSMVQTTPKITRIVVFRAPKCRTNQLSRKTWMDAIDARLARPAPGALFEGWTRTDRTRACRISTPPFGHRTTAVVCEGVRDPMPDWLRRPCTGRTRKARAVERD